MQKILSVEQIREGDARTIENEPIASVDLMERAGNACTAVICDLVSHEDLIGVLAGRGNNGGDGLVIARKLVGLGYLVEVFLVGTGEEGSADFKMNLKRLVEAGIPWTELDEHYNYLELDNFHWLVDAIFGSGLSRPVTGLPGMIIDAMNISEAGVIAIDMPSGLFADSYTDPLVGSIVEADYTLTLELPKLAMVMPSSYTYTGEWRIIPIGLDAVFLYTAFSPNHVFTFEDACDVFIPRERVSHKGDHGHGLLVAGSRGKGGAALLAGTAALRSGAGLLTAVVPESLELPFHVSLPEAMLHIVDGEGEAMLPDRLARFTAIAMGPGLGTGDHAARMLHEVITNGTELLLLDADALNVLSLNPEWLDDLPKGTILTPHPKEFERLAGRAVNDFHRLELAIRFASRYDCVVVLKTAWPVVVTPEGSCAFSVHGTAGMAKGGSGDTLTGIILGFLCRGYAPERAALMGVWIHARAASIVSATSGLDAMLPSDVTLMLGKAFKELETGMLLTNPGR